MSRGLTIADFVQQVNYAIYKVRLDTGYSLDGAFHADTDKFKEVVMEANLVLQDLQVSTDWNWLRSRRYFGLTENPECDCTSIQEINLDDYPEFYKICTGFNDAVRLHDPDYMESYIEVPLTLPRSGSHTDVSMFDSVATPNVVDTRLRAFQVGRILSFTRRFTTYELGLRIETDVIDYLEPLHICDVNCVQPCPQAYEDLVFTRIPDPYYMILRTAAKRAEGDPSVPDRAMTLGEESSKLLSAIRENDASKTYPDTASTIELGYFPVL
jgi:hypothetical protein